ncbi:MAG: hypothetical protein RL591_208 [Planctomycetota bacterium]
MSTRQLDHYMVHDDVFKRPETLSSTVRLTRVCRRDLGPHMQNDKHSPASTARATARAARFTSNARPIKSATHFAALTLAFTFGLASTGCQVAKQTLRADFTDFNTIIQRSQNEQMLLNLVRMRFREAPLFLQAGSLTASYENTVSAGADATAQQGDQSLIGVTGTYTFSSKPTIAYTPVEGQQYVQQLMNEIPTSHFGMLLRAGWPVQKLCDLLVECVTPTGGELLSARPKSRSYHEYKEFVATLVAAEAVGQLAVLRRADGGFDLKAEKKTIALENFRLRSLFSAMFEAAESIEVPESQRAWTTAASPSNELHIRATAKPSIDALVTVEYAGWNYSIANDDVRSKDTLALFMQLCRIQSGAPAPGPVLTIPAR